MEGIVVSIDIGTSKVCTLVGKLNKTNQVEILGQGEAFCSGVKKGIIVDIENTAETIRDSVGQAEKSSDFKIGSAYVNIVGSHVEVVNNRSAVSISNDNREIAEEDVDRALYSVRDIPLPDDRQVIDVIPRQYIVDGYDEIIDPVGMVGLKLEIEADVVIGKITSVQNIIRSMEKAGIKTDGLIVEAYATSEILLTPEEKEIGVILIDVGGGLTDISVFKKGRLLFNDSIPVGGDHITNDISIGLGISYSEAEKVKKQFELALTSLIKNDQEFSVFDVKEDRKKEIRVSQLVEIIEARVYEIFSLCRELLEKNNIQINPGAGVVLAGGGISYVDGNKQLANEVFDLPVRVGTYNALDISKPEYATASGIIKYVSGQHKFSTIISNSKNQKQAGKSAKTGKIGLLKRIISFLKEMF